MIIISSSKHFQTDIKYNITNSIPNLSFFKGIKLIHVKNVDVFWLKTIIHPTDSFYTKVQDKINF